MFFDTSPCAFVAEADSLAAGAIDLDGREIEGSVVFGGATYYHVGDKDFARRLVRVVLPGTE